MTDFDPPPFGQAQPWHAGPLLLDQYALGALDPVRAGSVEAHVTSCAQCRSYLATAVPPDRLGAIFAEVVDRVDAPRVGAVERLLCRIGVRADVARLLVVTPLVRSSWLLAVLGVLTFALAAAHTGPGGLIAFLTLAPLAPLAGVATAFGPRVDPSHEVTRAAPYRAFRLLLVRTVAVLGVTVMAAVPASLLLPEHRAWSAWAWLLPSLALATVTLAASERVDPTLAAAAVGALWVGFVVMMRMRNSGVDLFGDDGQLVFAVITACSALVVRRDRDRFDYSRGNA